MNYKGLHLVVRRLGYTHHGIGDGFGGVIHYSGLAEGLESGPVCRATLKKFSGDEEINVRSYSDRKYNRDEAVERAESRLGEEGYSVFNNNCEHFVEWCITGNHESKQVDRATTVGAAGSTAGAYIGATSIVASQGVVAGLSGSGIMSGLASVGGAVGGGAIAGAGALAGAGGLGAAALINNTVLKDSEYLPEEERDARKLGRGATVAGATAATAGGVAAIGVAGTTAGLSAAGITSGLAAIGGTVGGGMAAGTAIVAAAPVAAAAAVGLGAYKLFKWIKR